MFANAEREIRSTKAGLLLSVESAILSCEPPRCDTTIAALLSFFASSSKPSKRARDTASSPLSVALHCSPPKLRSRLSAGICAASTYARVNQHAEDRDVGSRAAD